MSVRCFFLRRRFMPYIDGVLAEREAARLSRHLAGCPRCGQLFERVRSGDAAGRRLGRLGRDPASRPPEFEEIWERTAPDVGGRAPAGRAMASVARAFSSPLAVGVLLAVVVPSVILVVSHWRTIGRAFSGILPPRTVAAGRAYRPLSIREFAGDSRDRVVTEGFVHKVYFDEEERTLHIKLVEMPHKPDPFVICEVRDSRGLTIPQEGSRVRVYGTARYDAQAGRGWHEVNPVMDIAVLKR
jgi:Putative zinc-finger